MSTPAPTRGYYAEEVAARLEISLRTLSGWVKDGKAPPSQVRHGRREFDAADFEEWLAAQNGVRR
jgi:excisionase family DNA binding protein